MEARVVLAPGYCAADRRLRPIASASTLGVGRVSRKQRGDKIRRAGREAHNHPRELRQVVGRSACALERRAFEADVFGATVRPTRIKEATLMVVERKGKVRKHQHAAPFHGTHC